MHRDEFLASNLFSHCSIVLFVRPFCFDALEAPFSECWPFNLYFHLLLNVVPLPAIFRGARQRFAFLRTPPQNLRSAPTVVTGRLRTLLFRRT
jgi:hypothetical protein